jgi:hypothetical protein
MLPFTATPEEFAALTTAVLIIVPMSVSCTIFFRVEKGADAAPKALHPSALQALTRTT